MISVRQYEFALFDAGTALKELYHESHNNGRDLLEVCEKVKKITNDLRDLTLKFQGQEESLWEDK